MGVSDGESRAYFLCLKLNQDDFVSVNATKEPMGIPENSTWASYMGKRLFIYKKKLYTRGG